MTTPKPEGSDKRITTSDAFKLGGTTVGSIAIGSAIGTVVGGPVGAFAGAAIGGAGGGGLYVFGRDKPPKAKK